MIKAINSKTFENLRDGVIDGMDSAWKASKRVQFRSPMIYDRPSPARTGGWIGLGIVSIAALALGAWMYFRKKKQVADRYTMGEGERSVGEGPGSEWQADQVPVNEQMTNPAH